MDTSILALEIEFEVTNMGQLQRLLGIKITFNHDSIKLSNKAVVDQIFEQFQMNDSDSTVPFIGPNTKITKEEEVLEAEDHYLYQSMIGSCIYLVTCTRPNLAYLISDLL
jgi:hypothetical protein